MITTPRKLFLLIFFSIGLISCSPLVSSIQPDRTSEIEITEGKAAGQTFTANYNGLQGVTLFLAPGMEGNGSITLSIYEDPDRKTIIAEDTKKISDINSSGVYNFNFNPVAGSSREDYYLELSIEGSGSILVSAGLPTSYLDGAMYVNGLPVDKQLSFRLIYDKPILISGLIQGGFRWLCILLLCFILFVVPGWIILSLVFNNWGPLFWGIKLGLAIGTSLSIYPIFFLWTNVINLSIGVFYAWIPVVLSIIIWIIIRRREIFPIKFSLRNRLKKYSWPDFTLAVLLIFIFGIRFWVIRSLDLPLWGDSYQHTMITQLILDNQGLFSSWSPYADLVTFTYHYGFHSFAAVFAWASGFSSTEAILWIGQVLNGFAVIALLPIASIIRRNIWTGIVTVLLAGLIFSMPMFYTNWGRYTQLGGLILLAAFAYFSWSLIEKQAMDWLKFLLSIVTLTALALTHFRILFFAIILLVILIGFYLKTNGLKNSIRTLLVIGTGSFILFLPWFVNIFSGLLLDILDYQLGTAPIQQSSGVYSLTAEIGNIFTYLPELAWLALPFLIGWALWRRSTPIAIITMWWIIVFIFSIPQVFGLPGAGSISAFAVVISLFFPASLILGEFAGWLIDKISPGNNLAHNPEENRYRRQGKYIYPIISLLLIVIGLWGVTQRKDDIDINTYTLVTMPDIQASSWIIENLPENSNMLVNSFFAYGGSLIAGSDGGWWLPLLADTANSAPPLNYGSEKGAFPGYQQWINELTAKIEDNNINHPDVLNMLKSRQYTHVYIGQRQGSVNSPSPLLNVKQLLASSHYTPIYHQDLVWIFEINY